MGPGDHDRGVDVNTGYRGIDIRQEGTQLLFDVFFQSSTGDKVTSGTTTLTLYEVQNDGTLKSYDFDDDTFKATALTTETASMTHRKGNNNTTDTGIWTYALMTVSGFTPHAIYYAQMSNDDGSPPVQTRKFQYGQFATLNPTTKPAANDPTALLQAIAMQFGLINKLVKTLEKIETYTPDDDTTKAFTQDYEEAGTVATIQPPVNGP